MNLARFPLRQRERTQQVYIAQFQRGGIGMMRARRGKRQFDYRRRRQYRNPIHAMVAKEREQRDIEVVAPARLICLAKTEQRMIANSIDQRGRLDRLREPITLSLPWV